MMKKVIPILLFLILSLLFVGTLLLFKENLFNIQKQYSTNDVVYSAPQIVSPTTEESENVSYKVLEVANNLFVPWSIAFTDENRAFIAERNGAVRVMENDIVADEPILFIKEVSTTGEEGLMGLAIDPAYKENKRIYVCYAYDTNTGIKDRVARYIDKGQSLVFEKIILDSIPAAQFHAGCRLKFGPDEKLYVTTGDAVDKELAQDDNSLAGKILRLNPDGSIPEDNPSKDSYIYSKGHRNPQGITWDPMSKIMFETEHGPSGFDGPPGGDEVNVIRKGGNYGWPEVSHEKTDPKYVDPVAVYTPAVAPGSALFYTGDLFPQFRGKLLFGGLRGEGIYVVEFENENFEKVIQTSKISEVEYGRIREVVQSPNGEIYFTTSNKDGRGVVQRGDDKIYKITL